MCITIPHETKEGKQLAACLESQNNLVMWPRRECFSNLKSPYIYKTSNQVLIERLDVSQIRSIFWHSISPSIKSVKQQRTLPISKEVYKRILQCTFSDGHVYEFQKWFGIDEINIYKGLRYANHVSSLEKLFSQVLASWIGACL